MNEEDKKFQQNFFSRLPWLHLLHPFECKLTKAHERFNLNAALCDLLNLKL